METLQTFALVLCVAMLAGLVVYTLELRNIPGSDKLVQKAEARRRISNSTLFN